MGTEYFDTYERFRVWAAQTNGVYPPVIADGIPVPKLTRAQCCSLVRFSVKVVPDTPTDSWYAVILPILGYRQEGDRFNVHEGWRNGFPPVQDLVQVWTFALAVAQVADTRNLPYEAPRPLPATDYSFMAGKAWAEMKKRRPDDADDILPAPVPGPGAPPGGVVPGPGPQPPLGPVSSPDDLDAAGRKKKKPDPLGGAVGIALLAILLLSD